MSCGFDSLPNLATTKKAKHGMAFNMLVVGPKGIGKTTLINSLFNFDYYDSPDHQRGAGVELRLQEYLINEAINMKITIIETKGFNNQLDRSEMYKPIVDYIEAKNAEYLENDLLSQPLDLNSIDDNRVHCCIYMISPIARDLEPIDIATMQQLHQRVCLIPVIGLSDLLDIGEQQAIKRTIMKRISENGIQIYSPKDQELPFAVTGSNEIINENGVPLRFRSRRWGRMFIERDSDFPLLRDLLLKNDMLNLIDTTNKVHYMKYRTEAIEDAAEYDAFEEEYLREKEVLLREICELERLPSKV